MLFWSLILYKPIPEFLVKSLEDKFSYREETFLELEGIIVLGGSIESGKITEERNDISIGSSSERVFKSLQFLQPKPRGIVIFTGLSGRLFHEGLSEAEITEWLVETGDDVEQGDVVLLISTTKTSLEIEAPTSGKISQINSNEGDLVQVGEVVCTIE